MHIFVKGLDEREIIICSDNIILEKLPIIEDEEDEETSELGNDEVDDIEDDDDTPTVPTGFRYFLNNDNSMMIEIPLSEYKRIKEILRALNGELMNDIIGQVSEDTRDKLKKSMSAIFRMEI